MILFDSYRDKDTRKDMLEYVMRARGIEAKQALAELASLNHVGLAYVYRDMLREGGNAHMVDYDPSEYSRP